MNENRKLLEDLQREYTAQTFNEDELQRWLDIASNSVQKTTRVTGTYLNEVLADVFRLIGQGHEFDPNGGSQVLGGHLIIGGREPSPTMTQPHIAIALLRPSVEVTNDIAAAQSGVESAYRQSLEERKAELLDRIASLKVEIEDQERAAADEDKKAARVAKARLAAAKELGV